MNNKLSSLHKKIDTGTRLAIQKAILQHRQLDQKISIYQDGQLITLKGEEIDKFLEKSE